MVSSLIFTLASILKLKHLDMSSPSRYANGWGEQKMSKKTTTDQKQTWKISLLFICSMLLLFSSIIIAVSIGPITIPFQDTVASLLQKIGMLKSVDISQQYKVVIMDVRLPRVIIAGLVGAALAISGVAM